MRLDVALRALAELGVRPVAQNALYRLGLASGQTRRRTQRVPTKDPGELRTILPIPEREQLAEALGEQGRQTLLAEADEIAAGRVRLFGGETVRLDLTAGAGGAHWTEYERKGALLAPFLGAEGDIKFLWESARFGWVFALGRAWHLTGDGRYADAFWRYFEDFDQANPYALGAHWMSGQEVGLRLMAWVWAAGVFAAAPASSRARMARLARAVAEHASRIPPTQIYARSQQNNHPLSESAALLTAGLALPQHPRAQQWAQAGWTEFNATLMAQIDEYGEYIQHSSNYQRLMLSLALWVNAVLKASGWQWSALSREALGRATHWMLSLLDSASGGVPNLGANDGANLFACSVQPFADFRPVLHAAARVFLNYTFESGTWDEQALWFNAQPSGPRQVALKRYPGDQLYSRNSWALLRTAQYRSRPVHADQLHLDLWWRGMNIARDAGTYLYNAPAPWENRLTVAQVHNTITVDGQDQMWRAGRFLYLKRADAYRRDEIAAESEILQRVTGKFRPRLGRHTHKRTVEVRADDRWVVRDEILPYDPARHIARLHWLLPDWEWELEPEPEGMELRLRTPFGWMHLSVYHDLEMDGAVTLVRAGECLHGEIEPPPQEGWFSPTYGVKEPALSLALTANGVGALHFTSDFTFPAVEEKSE